MWLRQVGVLSVRLVDGALGATMGVISGVFMSVVSLVGASMAGRMGTTEMMMGPIFLIIAPLMYGVIGFIAALLNALLNALVYNIVAGMTGGLEFQFDPHM